MSRVLRATGTAFIAIGLLILLFVLYELVGTTAVTKRHQSALQREFRTVVSEPAPKERPKRTVSGGIARLRIPRIDVDVIVVEGVTLADLAKGPGHYPDTARIGAKGTTAIAGHRTGWGAPFFDLDRLRVGDPVFLETTESTFTYRITTSTVVEPSDVWVLDGDPNSEAPAELVLTTCTPKFTSRDRLIFFGELVKAEPRAQSATEAA